MARAVHMHAQHHVMLVTHHQCPMQLVAHDQVVMLEGLVVKEMKQLTVYVYTLLEITLRSLKVPGNSVLEIYIL